MEELRSPAEASESPQGGGDEQEMATMPGPGVPGRPVLEGGVRPSVDS